METRKRIKRLRQKLDMTQEEFAKYIGVSWRTVMRWESGDSQPSNLALEKIEKLEKKDESQNGGLVKN